MTETEIQKEILETLNKLEGVKLRRNSVGSNGRYKFGLGAGTSDLIGWYEGCYFAVEVKVPGKTPTKEQQDFIDEVNTAGGIAYYADSVEMAMKKLRSATGDFAI